MEDTSDSAMNEIRVGKVPGSPHTGNTILSISIRDREVLHATWMPFLENGGLFIPGAASHAMGDAVFMLCSLMDQPERIPVSGTVVWVTPANAESKKPQGIGVQFRDRDNAIRPIIEKYLAAEPNTALPTHTL